MYNVHDVDETDALTTFESKKKKRERMNKIEEKGKYYVTNPKRGNQNRDFSCVNGFVTFENNRNGKRTKSFWLFFFSSCFR